MNISLFKSESENLIYLKTTIRNKEIHLCLFESIKKFRSHLDILVYRENESMTIMYENILTSYSHIHVIYKFNKDILFVEFFVEHEPNNVEDAMIEDIAYIFNYPSSNCSFICILIYHREDEKLHSKSDGVDLFCEKLINKGVPENRIIFGYEYRLHFQH